MQKGHSGLAVLHMADSHGEEPEERWGPYIHRPWTLDLTLSPYTIGSRDFTPSPVCSPINWTCMCHRYLQCLRLKARDKNGLPNRATNQNSHSLLIKCKSILKSYNTNTYKIIISIKKILKIYKNCKINIK